MACHLTARKTQRSTEHFFQETGRMKHRHGSKTKKLQKPSKYSGASLRRRIVISVPRFDNIYLHFCLWAAIIPESLHFSIDFVNEYSSAAALCLLNSSLMFEAAERPTMGRGIFVDTREIFSFEYGHPKQKGGCVSSR
ncbi:hypothetical protein TNCV_800781 [Trichonephila clavipes]|nr:hypothetical protein TNCV_800781 [Trichonephila clavipes]